MPAGLRKHVRYPELLLRLQAEVYGLYHMTNPEVFYNRERTCGRSQQKWEWARPGSSRRSQCSRISC